MNELNIFCDGGARGNPGPAASSFVIEKNGVSIFEQAIYLGVATNNIAEYKAVLAAFKWLEKYLETNNVKNINFLLDSQLVVNQLNGKYKIKSEKLKQIIYSIKNAESKIKSNISYSFIRRNKNFRADFLVNKKLDENSIKISRPRKY